MKGEVNRQYLTSETVNGYATKKYEVHYLDKDTLHKAHQWIASGPELSHKNIRSGRELEHGIPQHPDRPPGGQPF